MPCHYSKLTGTLSGCFSLILADSADLTSGAKIKMEKQVNSMLNYKASNCISVAHCWDPLQIMRYLPCLLIVNQKKRDLPGQTKTIPHQPLKYVTQMDTEIYRIPNMDHSWSITLCPLTFEPWQLMGITPSYGSELWVHHWTEFKQLCDPQGRYSCRNRNHSSWHSLLS